MFLKNDEITASTVRVLSSGGEFIGVFSKKDAISLAAKNNTDLVCTNGTDLCKLVDYGKFLYEQKKKAKLTKQKVPSLKEIILGQNTGQHDLTIKADKIKKFFEHGDRVKITLILRGRERENKNLAEQLMKKFLAMVGPHVVEKELQESVNGMSVQIKGVS